MISEEEQYLKGRGGDMGRWWWGECESRREMILSVLSPGHRYWREEGGLLHPHTTLQSILSGKQNLLENYFLTLSYFDRASSTFLLWSYLFFLIPDHPPAEPFIQLCETGTDDSIRRKGGLIAFRTSILIPAPDNLPKTKTKHRNYY